MSKDIMLGPTTRKRWQEESRASVKTVARWPHGIYTDVTQPELVPLSEHLSVYLICSWCIIDYVRQTSMVSWPWPCWPS